MRMPPKMDVEKTISSLLDPRWQLTLPHLVVPRDNEWLPGLLTRCDQVNDWPTRTTYKLVTSRTSRQRRGRLLTGIGVDFGSLSQLLSVSAEALESTTFGREVRSLYGNVAPSHVGAYAPFQVCPLCIADSQLLARTLALPFVRTCPIHSCLLVRTCSCDRPLKVLEVGTEPFTCGGCYLPWAKLPTISADTAVANFDRELVNAYDRIFSSPKQWRPALRRRLLVRALDRKKFRTAPATPGTEEFRAPRLNGFGLSSLALGKALLISRRASNRIGRSSRPKPPCPNMACPFWGTQGGNVVHNGIHRTLPSRVLPDSRENSRRSLGPEYYCNECGTIFNDRTIVLTFDINHGSVDVPPEDVLRLRWRLGLLQERLEAACKALLASTQPISIARAFKSAAIPDASNLRARQLGLVDIVARYAAIQEEQLDGMEPAQRWSIRKRMYKRFGVADSKHGRSYRDRYKPDLRPKENHGETQPVDTPPLM